jgi:hypothetical protein
MTTNAPPGETLCLLSALLRRALCEALDSLKQLPLLRCHQLRAAGNLNQPSQVLRADGLPIRIDPQTKAYGKVIIG